jgi:hypothetical protein
METKCCDVSDAACEAFHGCGRADCRPAFEFLTERAKDAAKPIAAFLEGTIVYTVSKQWDDLLSIYVFGLHQRPYCGDDDDAHAHHHCHPEGSSSAQFAYSATLLLLTSALQAWAEYGPLPYRWHRWRTSSYMRVAPKMIGMCIGWALGNACKATFLQIDTKDRGEIECTAAKCNGLNILFCVLATLFTAVVMVAAQPVVSGALHCGNASCCQLGLNCYLRVLALLLRDGLATTVKILWTFSFKGFLTWGVAQSQEGTPLFQRALLLWAVSLSAVFAAGTVHLRRWRSWCEIMSKTSIDEYHQRRAAAESGVNDAGGGIAAAATATWCVLDWRALCVQYLEIMEGTLGWVVGCAWSDAFVAYTPLGVNTIERPMVAMEDVGVAAAFTMLGVLWLLLSGQQIGTSSSDAELSQREDVEAFFTTNAFVFFVGWSWVVTLRDATALVFLGVSMAASGLSAWLPGASKLAASLEACAVILLGPALTVGLLWAEKHVRPFQLIETTLRGRSRSRSSEKGEQSAGDGGHASGLAGRLLLM